MISAGRVLIVPRGKWKADETYHMLDLVEHNGYAYIAKRTVAVIEPSDERTDYWHNLFDVNTIVEKAVANIVDNSVAIEIEKVIGGWESQLSELQETSADHSTQLESLQSEADAHSESIENLQNEVDAQSENINNLDWITFGTVTCNEEATQTKEGSLIFSVDNNLIHKLSAIRYVIKKDSTFYIKLDKKADTVSSPSLDISNVLGEMFSYEISVSEVGVFEDSMTLAEDIIINCLNKDTYSTDKYTVSNGNLYCTQSLIPIGYETINYKLTISESATQTMIMRCSFTIELQGKI